MRRDPTYNAQIRGGSTCDLKTSISCTYAKPKYIAPRRYYNGGSGEPVEMGAGGFIVLLIIIALIVVCVVKNKRRGNVTFQQGHAVVHQQQPFIEEPQWKEQRPDEPQWKEQVPDHQYGG
jgi:hypothetical protein|tara:strand:+ start:95 stop:454 length:360 start_codon:yes stop_codon:yes gene_type:complete